MKNFVIHFSKIDHENDFSDFAKTIDGELINNNYIQFSGKIARGLIKKFHLDAGLYMRVWDISLNIPVELCKEIPINQLNRDSFSLLFILTPESLLLKNVGEHQQYLSSAFRSTFFASDDVAVTFQVPAHKTVQLIDFSIHKYWLEQQQPDAAEDYIAHINNSKDAETNGNLVKLNPCTPKENLSVNKLFRLAINDQSRVQDEVLAAAETLVKEYLERKFSDKDQENKQGRSRDGYYDKIMEVEDILSAHLQSQLPSLGIIARQVALSESTLKRYFKTTFGRSVYDYYLEKKMVLARKLLVEKFLTVNEAAEMMGYEKVSNFISIFKKHHGYSPGSIKKRGYQL